MSLIYGCNIVSKKMVNIKMRGVRMSYLIVRCELALDNWKILSRIVLATITPAGNCFQKTIVRKII